MVLVLSFDSDGTALNKQHLPCSEGGYRVLGVSDCRLEETQKPLGYAGADEETSAGDQGRCGLRRG